MMPRNFSRAAGSSLRRPLQRLDEAEQRRERRAQFVAGIGDEIGAHLLHAAQRREVVESHSRMSHGALRRRPRAGPASRRPRTIGRAVRARRIRHVAAHAVRRRGGWHRPASGIRKLISAGSPRRNAGAMPAAVSLNAITRPSAIQHDCGARQTTDKLLGQQGLRLRQVRGPLRRAALPN